MEVLRPHTFQLKPSHATMLQEADIVFWIGEDLESFLETPLESIAAKFKTYYIDGI
jgi:zinc transport system substrate-binding protein